MTSLRFPEFFLFDVIWRPPGFPQMFICNIIHFSVVPIVVLFDTFFFDLFEIASFALLSACLLARLCAYFG